jgi:hypothetical protein
MSRRLGLDVDQMTTLVRTLKTEADQLEATIKAVTARVREVWWEGPDATRFKGTDWVAHAKALTAAATSLRSAAASAEKQVQEQVSASSR